jgi:S-adenosylmethionine decarboxylase
MAQFNGIGEPGMPFFEGTEKKVELVIDTGLPSLRSLGEEYWIRVARRAGAQVLSRLTNQHCEAYLLSESSLFVYPHKMIMITCGQTRLAGAVRELLQTYPAEQVRFFVYERKNEVFPHIQPTSFFDDIRELNDLLPGKAFQFGSEDDHHLYLFHLDRPFRGDPKDTTAEILMYGLDEPVRQVFRRGAGKRPVREQTGMAGLIPGFEIDDHLFEPSGYSLNAIRDDQYWTVHVTPERISSYASFETNYHFQGDLDDVAHRVLDFFRPRSFDVVLFDRTGAIPFDVERYRLKQHVAQELNCGYQVRFLSFFRPHEGIGRPLEIPVGS